MDEQLTKALRNRAIQLLAQRDYSSCELSQKLMLFLRKQFEPKLNRSVKRQRYGQPAKTFFVSEDSYALDNTINNNIDSDDLYEQLKLQFNQQIANVIDYCVANHWINDDEYAKKYTEMQARKGYGKYRINMELTQRGLSADLIQSAFLHVEIDWVAIAAAQMAKKFKQIDKKDLLQKRKVMQFLLARGFSQDEIKLAYCDL
ncbi:regulatory protein RecX [Orbaceae bacterium ESL0727]|nr:regulatory protein RecX [Orbaceae bacterium ESL0727]